MEVAEARVAAGDAVRQRSQTAATGGQRAFLSMLPVGVRERRMAMALALFSLATLGGLAAFARIQLPRIDAFIPMYQSALAISDLITAVLLFGQFTITRSRGLLILASAYLFAALTTVAHTLSFPGLFAPTGLLGAGPQTTAWLYMFWHGGFPLLVAAYAIVDGIDRRSGRTVRSCSVSTLIAIGTICGAVGAFVLASTAGQSLLPAIMAGHAYTPTMIGVVSSVWVLSLIALAVLWSRRPHSVLDQWLMVVMCAWLCDVALSAVLNAGRFDLGFYAGRAFGLLAASVVLMVLLLETRNLYAQLARKLDSERSEALGLAQQSGKMLKATIDAAPFAIISMDRVRNIELWNAAAGRIFGYSADEVLGRPYKLLVPPDHQSEHETNYRTVSNGGHLSGVITRRRRKDGTDIKVRVCGSGIFDANGAFRSAVFALEDVTHELLIEQQLRQSQKMEAIGNLTGGIAHDFNNMLGVIIGNLDLLEESLPTDGEAAGYARQALAAGLRGSELVQRILAFSRRQSLNPTNFDVNEAIDGIAPLMHRSLGETVSIELSLEEGAGRIAADKHQLENALLNLAINARDAMPCGGQIVIASRRAIVDQDNALMYPDLKQGDYVALSVTDTGQGIPADILPRVFEPFFTTKEEGKGTGLGLSMVYGFMRQSEGTAKIYSEVDHGTTVRLYFPRTKDSKPAEQPSATQSAAGLVGSERVLVVEDRDDMREVAVNTLTRLGYGTVRCRTGDEALDMLLAGEKVELVFSDIVMPGTLSGLDLAQEIRRRDLPLAVLLTSGYASPKALRMKAMELGLPLISKPYRAAELAKQVRTALETQQKVKVVSS